MSIIRFIVHDYTKIKDAIKEQEKEIANLEEEKNALIILGDYDKAIEKERRKELLERQIELVKGM